MQDDSFLDPADAADDVETDSGSQPTPLPLITYRDLQNAVFDGHLKVNCDICGDPHPLGSFCTSKPAYPPACYYGPRCQICAGYHPKYRCWFEYMRTTLFTPSFCNNCQVEHIGFCKTALYCKFCNRRHNFTEDCVQQISVDLSNNNCSNCGLYHTLHCPRELEKIKSDLILFCNRCRIEHKFMTCVPFCNKCFRRHREGPCPGHETFCKTCFYCHQGESCPSQDKVKTKKTSTKP